MAANIPSNLLSFPVGAGHFYFGARYLDEFPQNEGYSGPIGASGLNLFSLVDSFSRDESSKPLNAVVSTMFEQYITLSHSLGPLAELRKKHRRVDSELSSLVEGVIASLSIEDRVNLYQEARDDRRSFQQYVSELDEVAELRDQISGIVRAELALFEQTMPLIDAFNKGYRTISDYVTQEMPHSNIFYSNEVNLARALLDEGRKRSPRLVARYFDLLRVIDGESDRSPSVLKQGLYVPDSLHPLSAQEFLQPYLSEIRAYEQQRERTRAREERIGRLKRDPVFESLRLVWEGVCAVGNYMRRELTGENVVQKPVQSYYGN